MTNSKKANGLFLTMTVCIICFYLFERFYQITNSFLRYQPAKKKKI